MSQMGQKRRFDPLPITSGLPRSTDIIYPARLVRFVPRADLPDLGDTHSGLHAIKSVRLG
jgi:hypothetical protein